MSPRDWLAAARRAVRRPDRRWIAVAVVIALLGLNFEFTAHYVNSSQAAFQHQQHEQQREQAQQQAEQRAAALKQSKSICAALVGLDDARIGAVFAPQSRTGVPLSESYGYRLAQHLHDVVDATHCRALLAGKTPK
jgi:hypothetical protein